MVGSMGWKPDLCMVLFWCSDSLFSSLPSPLPAYPQTVGQSCIPGTSWADVHAGLSVSTLTLAALVPTTGEQSQVSLAGSHRHFCLSMVAGPASLSYAWHVCGHRGQLWSYLALVALVLCFVCLLLFLHNA